MAATEAEQSDPLLTLRRAIAAGKEPLLTTSADPTSAADAAPDIAHATHLQFNHDDAHRSFPLDASTRFGSPSTGLLDLRSVYFAWLNRDAGIQDYINATRRLNEELAAPGGAGGAVKNLMFVEKLDLVAWLQGTSDTSDHIKPLASEAAAAQAAGAADIAAGAAGGIATVPSAGAEAKAEKRVDPRLAAIYAGERKMGDQNSVLRGIKPTDFSHIRKIASTVLLSSRSHGNRPPTSAIPPAMSNPALVSNLKKPSSSRAHREPIILLSPSASSLLRMSNIKSFLQNGLFVPADSAAASSTTANILHISRTLPGIDPTRPLRFILVDTPDQFKPDYWSRLVAVFTTGQTWQFKSYKWTQPPELFSHALGVHVGWRGETVPDVVKSWGKGVVSVQLDRWSPAQRPEQRWRDREVVEFVWGAIEESMRAKGWGKDGVPR